RRHTRWPRDWCSDVCSSDLARLCDRAILLREGRVVEDGPSDQVVAHYLQAEGGGGSRRAWPDQAEAPGGKRVRIREVRVVDEHRSEERRVGKECGSGCRR